MIKMVFGGGLGNQLFQYAFLLAQIEKKNWRKKNILAIMHRNKNEDLRYFSLNCMKISLKIGIVNEEDAGMGSKLLVAKRRIWNKIFNTFGISGERLIALMNRVGIVYTPEIYKYYENLKLEKSNIYVEGAFQSWKYFDSIRDKLLAEFCVSYSPSKQNKILINEIESCNAICVHVRRGDYINKHYAKTLALCDYQYYKEGMDFIASKVENPVFFIFSNSSEDHEWIKKNYYFNYEVRHVDLDNPDYEELRLMYTCKHFIISNSTFSWWAQYLSPYENKQVVAPSKWYNGNVDTTDIYMPSWKLINVGEDRGEIVISN